MNKKNIKAKHKESISFNSEDSDDGENTVGLNKIINKATSEEIKNVNEIVSKLNLDLEDKDSINSE